MITMQNYVSPSSFTNLDMDWSPDSTDISCQKSKYVDALRLAVWERMRVFGSHTTVLFYPDYIPCPGACLNIGTLQGLHGAIRDLIGRFVNHTKQNGDFTGLSNIPYWTEKEIFDYLQEDAYYYPQPGAATNTAWLKQQYRIINLLRWTNGTYWSIFNSNYAENARYFTKCGDHGGITVADMIQNFINSPKYFPSSMKSIEYIGGAQLFIAAPMWFWPNFYLTMSKSTVTLPLRYIGSIRPIITWYSYTGLVNFPIGKYTTPFVFYKEDDYIPNEAGIVAFDSYPYSFENIDQINASLSKISSSNFDVIFELGCHSGTEDGNVILKFDGPNGFKFCGEDW